MIYHRYESLQHNDSIRILALHPSSSDLDPILCTMQYARLSDPSLEYEAVSYTWGNATLTKTIQFNNGRESQIVGKNCHAALRRLRLRDKDRLIWIDAICINQEDIPERTCQVRMMDQIYSRAFNIAVYLGEHTAGSRLVFEELAAADEELRQTGDCDRPYPSENIVQELEILYQLPWFKRVWVLQEVCSKPSVTILCGSSSASFDTLRDLHFGYEQDYRVTNSVWPLPLELIHRPLKRYSTPQFNLWNQLYASRSCLATDPRDKVFALKSLIGPAQSEMEFLIDYTKTVEQCFVEVAKFLLPVLGLRILTAIRHRHKKDMPSWIPDWAQDLPLNFIYFEILSWEESLNQPTRKLKPQDYQKHEIRPIPVEKSENRLELLATGCEYAHIEDTSQVFLFHDIFDAKKQMEWLFSYLGHLAKTVENDRDMTHQLGNRIVDVKLGQKEPIDNEDAVAFFESLHQCRISLMGNKELAIVPACAERGDVVCILSGTDAPCVLRSGQPENWTLISGDCYIFADSYIDGNGWFLSDDFMLSRDQRAQQFKIR
ncbi:HET-domain-containing protein [Periconia macrospinosa]|uniref:HET-domain-containing protein n=1 Tax=Periconia macrospinosa TaxID=97972 RepID=A0A2V1DF16_9PLEO|nr:HET-domain-containing protein [Periconia macrospinosa]